MEQREISPRGSSQGSSRRSSSRRLTPPSLSPSPHSFPLTPPSFSPLTPPSPSSGSSSGSSRISSSGSSQESLPDPDVKVPHWTDNQAMLLWRATVDPLKNVGAPMSAEWDYPDDVPNTAHENRSSIRQAVDRVMVLAYRCRGSLVPGIGNWTPGDRFESVFLPKNSGEYSDFPTFYVEHSTSMPLGTGYNSQYVAPQYYPMECASELVVEVLHDITRELYGKGKKYIRSYVDRYFVTPTISDEFTAEADKDARNMIVDIFLRANRERHDEVEDFVEDEWEQHIRDEELFSFIFFDENFLNDDLGVKLYNKKGKTLRPANKAEVRSGRFAGTQYTPRFNPSPTSPSRRMRRRRTQRKRDKKILKEYYEDMRRLGEDPNAIFDGGYKKKKNTRRRGRTMRKK